jgi:hypothetical protein
MKQNLYLSFDIEADGPSPRSNNMLSIGVVGFTADKKEVFNWQKNLKPLDDHKSDSDTMKYFWDKNPEIWKFVNTNLFNADDAMIDLGDKIYLLTEKYKLKWVAWPAAYDWQWLKYYYTAMIENNPDDDCMDVGFKATCISTMFDIYCHQNDIQDRDSEFNKLTEGHKVTHNPEDDARAQGIAFINLANALSMKL